MDKTAGSSRERAPVGSTRPAAVAAAVFIGGIIAHDHLPIAPGGWLSCAILAGLLSATIFQRRGLSTAALAVGVFLVGIAAAQIAAFYFPSDGIAAYSADQPRLARLELKIEDPLRLIGTTIKRGSRPLPPKQVTTATVTRVLTQSGWRKSSGQILLQIDPPNEKLAIGQTVRALGMLQRPSPAMNPGQFDWADCAVGGGAPSRGS